MLWLLGPGQVATFRSPEPGPRQPGLPPLRQPPRAPRALPRRWSAAVVASPRCCWCLLPDLGAVPVGWARLGFWYPYFQKKDGTSELGSGAAGACPQRLCLSVPLPSGPLRTGGAASPSSPRWAPERIGRCTELPEDVTEKKGGRPGRRQGGISWVCVWGRAQEQQHQDLGRSFLRPGDGRRQGPAAKTNRTSSWNGACLHPPPGRQLDQH